MLKFNDFMKAVEKLYEPNSYDPHCRPRVVYVRQKAIWPVWDRDVVNIVYPQKEGDIIYIATKSCGYKFPEEKGVVRAIVYGGGYILRKIDNKSCTVAYIADFDLCGSIPSMVQN